MCPRMIAGPMAPGVGEPVYQPGLESGSSRDGTWMVPSALRPRSISDELTPMAGTATATGGDAGSKSGPAAEVGAGVAAGLSVGAIELGLTEATLGDGAADAESGVDAMTGADAAAVVPVPTDDDAERSPLRHQRPAGRLRQHRFQLRSRRCSRSNRRRCQLPHSARRTS